MNDLHDYPNESLHSERPTAENLAASIQPEHRSPQQLLADLISGIQIAMLTTVDASGHLTSRPMVTQDARFDGSLWFFAHHTAKFVSDLERNPQVQLAYAEPREHRYVAVTGHASVANDRERMRSLWRPSYRAWFAQGVDDPDLTLLVVTPDEAEYWTSSYKPAVSLLKNLWSIASGKSRPNTASQRLTIQHGAVRH